MLNINIIINDPKGIESKLMTRGYSLNSTDIINIYNQRKDLIKIKENIAADKNKLMINSEMHRLKMKKMK